jgi:hypothetical protein
MMIRLLGDAEYVPEGESSTPHVRGNWMQDNLEAALKKIGEKELSVSKASQLYQIPRQTLCDYVSKNLSTRNAQGRKPVLSLEEEKDLKARINRLSDIGFPVTPKVLRRTVYLFYLP